MKHLNGFSILPFALCIFLVLLCACDGGSGTSDESSSDTSNASSSDTGSIAFSLAWEEDATSKSEVLQAAQFLNSDVCVDCGIETISAEVYNSSDKEVKSRSWPCSDHQGTISDLPTGSGMWVKVQGSVPGEGVVWEGETEKNITVTAGQTTNAGTVTMNYIGDATPPTAGSPSPLENATDVAINSIVTATFSEAVNLAYVNASSFTLMAGTTEVSGSVTYIFSTLTATFTPDSSLSYSTAYTATVTTDVRDLAGNQMEQDYTWSFTTVPNAPPAAIISNPSDGNNTYAEGEEIGFGGSGNDPEDGHLSGNSFVWTSSRDGQIGTGESFTRDDLSVGTHTITLTVIDTAGAKGSVSITLSIETILKIIGSVDTPSVAHGVYVSGAYAYVPDYSKGLQIINITDPAKPTIVASVYTSNYARDVYISGAYA